MAGWNLQSRNADALLRCTNEGLAGIAHPFTTTPIDAVSTVNAYRNELVSVMHGYCRRFRIAADSGQAEAQQSLSVT
jgi:hypothetical protein